MNTVLQSDKLQASLYVPPGQRDCCGRCQHSVNTADDELRCKRHGSARVAAYAVCAIWKPIGRRVPA